MFKSSEKHEFKQSGLTLAVSSPAIDMAMKAQESLKRSNEVKNDKLSALYKIKAAQELLLAGQEAKDLAGTLGALANGDMKEGNISNPSVKISVSVGSSQSKQESHTNQVVHHGSELSAGNLSLKTTASDIDVIGSKLSATTLNLDSAKDIHLKSAQDSFSHRSQNNNSGWSAGVFVGASGNSYGVGLEASGYKGKGKENSDSTTQVNSLVQGKEVNISSQHDTALQGANVNADRLTMKVGNNLSIESRQDSNQYDSKQTQVNAGASVTLNGSGSASFNASRNKAKLNYAQVEEQSGLSAGEGGLAINVGNHTHLKGGLIESKAEESKNRLHTKTFSTEDIKNHSEVKVESHSVGLSTNMAQNAMSAVATTIGVLGNKNESKQSLTQSAVGNNIHFTAESQDEKTQQNLTALSRDTENANQKVQAYDLAEIKAQQEMAQVIGEIAQNSINLTLKPKLEEAEKQKAEAEAILANKETNANQRIQAQRQLDNANQTIQTYGQGGDMQMAIRAVTGLLQGIVTKNTGAAAVGLISPYANQFIKAQTGDNTTANLMAHALLGAIEAKATGTNALAGAAGALTGEAAAQIIAQKLYGIDGKSKTTNDLSESEKQTITALSQLAGGLAGGVIGDSTTSAVSSADIAKRAVENNFTLNLSSDWAVTAEANKQIDDIQRQAVELFEKEHPELIKKLKATGDVASFLADFTPIIGDAKSFAEAKDAIDYVLATVGVIPGADLVTKSLKEAKNLLNNARKAEKLGDIKAAHKYVEEATRHINHNRGNLNTSLARTCSFRGDMEVKTDKGYQPISSIKVGDKVLAKNEITGITTYQKVQAHYSNPYDYTVYVEVKDGRGKFQTIVSNKIHPFFAQVLSGIAPASSEGHDYNGEIAKAQWIDAQYLQKGYRLLSANGEWQTVSNVNIKAEGLKAYNMTVATDHTYFIRGAKADNEGVWVHNDCWINLPEGAKRIKDIDGYRSYQFKDHSGNDVIVIQKDKNRFETLDHNGVEVILPNQRSWEAARNLALEKVGDLGMDSKPLIGNLKISDGYGKIVGRISSDGKKGWRLDYDPEKGMHINIFDYSKGKGSNAIKEVIPFTGSQEDFNRYLKQLNK
ncbi:polymorphic toxin-type HINT domain-containing protein [Canicola haemoglobinophilus]|uniref:polymorphic toxin-type HINT domain-containing protein n=1 Tax=Canicola haemoglobinophilus TaxID=733 RepID=UPI0011C0829D|nr:polymorphic toxin-type HINT domain-containing protein [Canicola haemoglobinophilus]